METKTNTKKILALSIIVLFTFSLILPFAFAQGSVTLGNPDDEGDSQDDSSQRIGNARPIVDPFVDMFTNWERGNVSPKLAKYIFWLIVTLIIYSVMGVIPLFDSTGSMMPFVRWLLSIIVGFLSVAYLTPDEIYALMVSYSALGFVLGGFLPILALLLFQWSVAANSPSSKNAALMQLLISLMWAAYAAFSFTKTFFPPQGITPNIAIGVIFTIIGFVMVFETGAIWKWMRKEVTQSQIDRYKEDKKLARVSTKEDAEDVRDA